MGRLYIYLPFVPWKSTINVGKYTVRSHGSCDGTDGCPGLLSESFADWEPTDPSGENTNSLVRKKAEGNPFFSARIFEMCFLFFLCFFWECWTIICLFFLRISLGVYYIRTIINNPNKFPDFLCSVSFFDFHCLLCINKKSHRDLLGVQLPTQWDWFSGLRFPNVFEPDDPWWFTCQDSYDHLMVNWWLIFHTWSI